MNRIDDMVRSCSQVCSALFVLTAGVEGEPGGRCDHGSKRVLCSLSGHPGEAGTSDARTTMYVPSLSWSILGGVPPSVFLIGRVGMTELDC